jgi:DNA polymerase-1
VRWLRANGFKDFEYWRAPSDLVGKYCYGDCLRTKRLWDFYKPQMDKFPSLWPLYQTETAIAPVIMFSELHGVRLDVEALERDKEELLKRVAEKNKMLCAAVNNTAFNFGSNPQIGAFFNSIGIKGGTTEGGGEGWDASVLENIDHPVAKLILDLRADTKILTTYVESYLKLNQNGRVYPNFNQMRDEHGGAVTGRMSSDGPNAQNIPKSARKYFIPDDGKVWLSVDYSQIEYRLFVHYSGDAALLKAYQDDPWVDFHRKVANMMEITRDPAKTINFGMLYAMGKAALIAKLGVDPAKGDGLFKLYHKTFPSVSKLRNSVEKKMLERGYNKNLFGRLRHIEDKRYSYKALNSLIQGGAADLFKDGIKRVFYEVCYDMGVDILLYVHDEMIFQLEESMVDSFLRRAVPVLQDFPQVSIPIRVDAALYRQSWGDNHGEGIPISLAWNGQPSKGEADEIRYL